MTARLIVIGLIGIAVLTGLSMLYNHGYSSGWAARDIEYQEATKALNAQIATLQADLAAERQKQVEENATATAEVIANIKTDGCEPLSKEQVSRLNRIR